MGFATMRRILLICFLSFVPIIALLLTSRVSFGQAQDPVLSDIYPEDIPRNDPPQNAPCIGQPKSFRELAASFRNGRLPLASQIKGTWVEIGSVSDYPGVPHDRSFNCSGITRGSKLEFVLVANDHYGELHSLGAVQKVAMEPDHKGSVEFPFDEGADEGPETFRCRLTKRDTLACLDSPFSGIEFKRMKLGKGQLY
jgi:hypothetical protein